MTVIKPFLLLKQYHSRSPVSLGALWNEWTYVITRPMEVNPLNLHVAIKEHMLHQDVHDHWVKREPYVIGKGCPVHRYAFGGWLIYGGIHLKQHESVPYGKEILIL